MAKPASERYSSAHDVSENLRLFLQQQPAIKAAHLPVAKFKLIFCDESGRTRDGRFILGGGGQLPVEVFMVFVAEPATM